MKLTFDISATEFVIVRDILADSVPPGCRVWVFGSRAKNQVRFNSDLDLALECKDKLPRIILHKLKEAFSDSLLPYRVDVLDIHDVCENFQTIIRQQAIAFLMSHDGKVPKLRFPEFSGEWEERKLGEIVKIERGRFSPRPRNDPKYYGGEIPFVQTSDVVKSKGKIREYSQTLNNLGLGVSKLFPKGSLLITIAANIGYAGVLELDMACPDSLIGLTCSKALNNYFLNYILEIEQPKMDYLAVEAAQKNINIEFIKPYKIDYPPIPEQRKIASFLSAIDTKIAQLTKKKALLEQYKRGVMQKLFSQELRFKDAQGKAFPEWVEKRLGEVSTITTGKKDVNEGNPNGKYPFFTCARQHTYSDHFSFDCSAILIAGNGEVGHCQKYTGKFEAYQRTYVLSDFGLNFNYMFVYLSTKFADYVESQKQMGAMPYIKLGALKTFPIPQPSLPEQQKIADFLSAIDLKIDLIATELEHTQTFKKGLLQHMFV